MRVAAESGHGAVEPADVEGPARACDGGGAAGAEPSARCAAQQGEAGARLAHAAARAGALAHLAAAPIAPKDRHRVASPEQVQRAALAARRHPQRARHRPAGGPALPSGHRDAAIPARQLTQRAAATVARQHGQPARARHVDAAAVGAERERPRAVEVASGRAAVRRCPAQRSRAGRPAGAALPCAGRARRPPPRRCRGPRHRHAGHRRSPPSPTHPRAHAPAGNPRHRPA